MYLYTKKLKFTNFSFLNNKPRDYHTSINVFNKTIEKKLRLRITYQAPKLDVDMSQFTPDLIRNFCIISHIDHGKTTLSTKLLEFTGTLSTTTKNDDPTYLDKLAVEKERGITIKAQTASMFYEYKGKKYLLNLIDTPGHVDFSYEVSRSLRACEGAVLLVEALAGIQAQTMANFWQAFEADLHIVPAINKVDMKNAQVPQITRSMVDTFGVDESSILLISGKTGLGINNLLESVIEKIPAPVDNSDQPFKSLLFDSWYGTDWTGVICLVKVVKGSVKVGMEIKSAQSQRRYLVTDVGVMFPETRSTEVLRSGQVGYITCGMKTSKEALVGDTLHDATDTIEPFPGFKEPKPMVYGGIFPADEEDFIKLDEAMAKLVLTDPSVSVQKETNDVLGLGYRCGFLGLLHMDVFSQRLRQEYAANVISTSPTVPYKIILKTEEEITVSNPSDWPDVSLIKETQEPVIEATIVSPKEYMGEITKLCQEKRAEQVSLDFIDDKRIIMKYIIPLPEVICQFYDKLKTITSGYASFDYEKAGYKKTKLCKVTILLNSIPVGPLSLITHEEKAYDQGKLLVSKLKEVLRRQQFEVAIQAAIGKKVIARETIKAVRKDVTAKCYGGDITRKRKLLERQKEGKKRMKQIGTVNVPQEAFLTLMKL